jgi:hypothetical protein
MQPCYDLKILSWSKLVFQPEDKYKIMEKTGKNMKERQIPRSCNWRNMGLQTSIFHYMKDN